MTSITGPLFAGGCIESSSSSTVLKQQDHMMLLNEGGSSQQSGAKRNSLSSASGGAHSTASSRSSSIKSNRGLGKNPLLDLLIMHHFIGLDELISDFGLGLTLRHVIYYSIDFNELSTNTL